MLFFNNSWLIPMNEFLRIVRKMVRPFGYDLCKKEAYNLRPFKNFEQFPDLAVINQAFSEEHKEISKSNLKLLKIIIRTCTREDRNVKNHSALTGSSLKEVVERCLISVVNSINDALSRENPPNIEVIILDDHSDAIYLEDIRGIVSKLQCIWTIQNTNTRGQGASLHQQFSMARQDDALYYFCEDDYLHEKTAIYELWAFYNEVYKVAHRHLILKLQGSESLHENSHYPSYILLSPYRYWRSTSDATHCFFTHSKVVNEYWHCFENTKYVGDPRKRYLGSESRTTNLIFKDLPGFSPIPALAGHLQSQATLPPFFDWKRLWSAVGAPLAGALSN